MISAPLKVSLVIKMFCSACQEKNDDKDVTKISYNEPNDNLGMGGNITQSKSSNQIVDFSVFYFVLYNYSITSLLFRTLVTNLVYKNKKNLKTKKD